ncbi:hypothetical protein [Massilia sp. BJB1822]|uniref:hypothetical protein n=1 Tax=Massilia sp. BJB1822 TaxID=2744470 RepID=UPI0015948B90|nr:hypothetical protein [Massilia sp. BJB1822]NVE01858.1 hypothetical protein [Massilia sp. BJB1822]
MTARRFLYALEPLRLTREWALDRLRLELSECNAALAQQQELQRAAWARAHAGIAEWQDVAGGQQAVTASELLLMQRYIADCHANARALDEEAAALETQRDALMDQVLAARRALDALEEHRDQALARFQKQRQNGEFKDADDQWGILQGGMGRDGNQSGIAE